MSKYKEHESQITPRTKTLKYRSILKLIKTGNKEVHEKDKGRGWVEGNKGP